MKNKMTVEEFFEKGLKFVDRDMYCDDWRVVTIGIDIFIGEANTSRIKDDERTVVYAKALEGPRTKVTYEKVKFNKLSEAFAEHERAPLYRAADDIAHINKSLLDAVVCDSPIYRKIEAEITPMQAAKEACGKEASKLNHSCKTFNTFALDEKLMGWSDYDSTVLSICRAIVNAYDGK